MVNSVTRLELQELSSFSSGLSGPPNGANCACPSSSSQAVYVAPIDLCNQDNFPRAANAATPSLCIKYATFENYNDHVLVCVDTPTIAKLWNSPSKYCQLQDGTPRIGQGRLVCKTGLVVYPSTKAGVTSALAAFSTTMDGYLARYQNATNWAHHYISEMDRLRVAWDGTTANTYSDFPVLASAPTATQLLLQNVTLPTTTRASITDFYTKQLNSIAASLNNYDNGRELTTVYGTLNEVYTAIGPLYQRASLTPSPASASSSLITSLITIPIAENVVATSPRRKSQIDKQRIYSNNLQTIVLQIKNYQDTIKNLPGYSASR